MLESKHQQIGLLNERNIFKAPFKGDLGGWAWALVLLLILGVYFPVKIPIPGTVFFIPNVFAVVLTVFAAIRSRRFMTAYIIVVAILCIYLIPNVWLTSNNYTTTFQKVRSFALLSFNVSIFFILSRSHIFARLRYHRAIYLLPVFCAFVAIYAFLESRSGIFQHISDNARAALYPANVIYVDDSRDVALTGGIRPKVFASEPAHVAFAVCALLLYFVALRPHYAAFIAASIIYAAVAIVVGSPFPFLLFPALYLTYVVAGGTGVGGKLLLVSSLVLVASVFAVWVLRAEFFGERFRLALEGREGSTTGRVWRQVEFAEEGLRRNILFGIGTGSVEELGIMLPRYEGIDRSENMNIQSPLLSIFILCGLVGMFLFAWVIWTSMNMSLKSKIAYFMAILLIFFQGGSITACPGWLISGVILSILNSMPPHKSVRSPARPMGVHRAMLPLAG